MRKLLYILLFFTASCAAQNNIKKTTGINYTRQAPNYTPNESTGSELAVDTITGYIWQWHRTPGPTVAGDWLRIGQGIDELVPGSAPNYIPFRNQSVFAVVKIGLGDSLYHYRDGAWWHMNKGGGGGGGGTWGSITGTLSDQTDLKAELDTKLEVEVDGSITNELQNLSLSGQALSISGGTGATLPIVGVSEGYGIDVTTAAGVATVKVDTAQIATLYDASQSIYTKWPLGHVKIDQPDGTQRNLKLFQNPDDTDYNSEDAYVQFDTIKGFLGSTTNSFGNGIWTATSGGPGKAVAGFSNHLQAGLGFAYMASGSALFQDWRNASTRGSILKAMNWTGGATGDMGITMYTSGGFVTNGTTKTTAGQEIGAIRFVSADTTAALNSTTKTFSMNSPCSAIIGYNYGTPFNNAYYGGVSFWGTNGSKTLTRTFTVDSTASTTVRMGVNVVPARANTLQVNGKTLIAGNLELSTAGNKILIATGSNASAGTATLVDGTVTVNTTAVTSNSIFYITCKTPITSQGKYSVPTIVNGTSFTINSDSAAEDSVVYWQFIN